MSKVSVILGSDSDIEIYREVSHILEDFDIPFEKRIISAHRTPDILLQYVKDAEKRGIKVFIAIAGMAAALPGVIASYTLLPVIGVPAASRSSVVGFDSLLSILQMPPGVPVACVAVNGGRNAALLATEILALFDTDLLEKLKSHRKNQKERVIQKDEEFRNEKEGRIGR